MNTFDPSGSKTAPIASAASAAVRSFEEMARIPAITSYEEAFSTATGVPLKVMPPVLPCARLPFGRLENRFCASVSATLPGSGACRDCQARLQKLVSGKRGCHQVACFAGLTVVAVPVWSGDNHVATLLSGQVFRRPPTDRDFQIVLRMIRSFGNADWERKLRRTYFETPVLTAERFEAILHLLNAFAGIVTQIAARHAAPAPEPEPLPVTTAKRFILSHATEPISLASVVDQVHLSPFYFCKLFKRATGMTLTEYVSRVRVERAKSMLMQTSLRISEIVYASGFGSIPRFNSVFRRQVGMAPTEYRATLRSPRD